VTICEDFGDESTTRTRRRSPTLDGVGVLAYGIRGVDGELSTAPLLFLTHFATDVSGVGTLCGNPC